MPTTDDHTVQSGQLLEKLDEAAQKRTCLVGSSQARIKQRHQSEFPALTPAVIQHKALKTGRRLRVFTACG